jgi:hypothetical protein
MKIQAGTSPISIISPQGLAILANDPGEAIRQGGSGIGHDIEIFWKLWGIDFNSGWENKPL